MNSSAEPLITGWAHSRFGKLDNNLQTMMSDVARSAVEDAGLDLTDIDAIHVGVFNNGLQRQGFESALPGVGIPELALTPATRHESACATGSAAIFSAHDAIASGRHRNVLVIGAEKMSGNDSSTVNSALLAASYLSEEEQYGSFAGVFGEVLRLYSERYSDPRETLAHIAAKNHANGARNPFAHMQKDLGFNFCNSVGPKNPEVAGKLRRTDCSMVSDGAAAVVVSQSDVVASNAKAIRWRGMGNANDAFPLSTRDPLAFAGGKEAMRQALTGAGIGIRDLDLLETHDCFTIAELLEYEAFGLAAPGHGAEVIDSGLAAANGDLPINPSGGLKSKGHPIGATGVSMHVIAAMQLTNTFPGIQLNDPELAGVFNMGGLAVSNYASVLERAN